ncbi:right-handed parallel beta-helix repeat-containing protein [Arthrobacter roseus]|uniref:right-handed parallel beta-helix repeat-containing protein n=1 Tax=Arthrobacter roseus TaxID=136274 RepID=UPI001965FB87|nr:parallel beta-helix repeat protein [Arthrobacter roseus]
MSHRLPPLRRFLPIASVVGALILGAAPPAYSQPPAEPASTVQDAETASTRTTWTESGVLLRDPMTRNVRSGWGKAPNGVRYTSSWNPALSVASGTGIVEIFKPGTSRTISASTAPAVDVRASVSTRTKNIPTSGGGIYSSLQLRTHGNAYYQSRLRFMPGGKLGLLVTRVSGGTDTVLADTLLPLRVRAGQNVSVEFEAFGTSSVGLKARAWVTGTTKPDWQVTARDSSRQRVTKPGTTRISTYVSSGSQAATVAYDNLDVRTYKPKTVVQPVPAPKPTPAPAPRELKAGSAPVGSTAYAVPSGAVVVSPKGSDAGKGSAASPYRSLAHAVSAATSGQTIVLRAGTYHEKVTIPDGKRLTIQPYPREAVWLDGSSVVDGFTRTGSAFVVNGWKHEFDPSPTYTWGAGDGHENGWTFVNPKYPMAAHPDQVWIDGAAQRQVSARDKVASGTFFVDNASDRLYLGSNPAGKTVSASTLEKAMSIRSAGTTVRGIGIRRYAPSVPHMGTLTAEQSGITLENLVITDNATTGFAVGAANNTVTNVTVARNGMLGATATYADNLKVRGLSATENNREHFNSSPVAGGLKVARTRGVNISGSEFVKNDGTGLWFDESVYNMQISGNNMLENSSHGVSVEISAKAVLINNVIAGNAGHGAKINNTSDVQVWNNTFAANGRALNIVQDDRRAANRSTPGHDPRQAFPDPTMTWLNGPATVRNNIMADAKASANCLLCVEDYSHEFSAEQMNVTAQGNVYHRASNSAPRWSVVWSNGAGNPSVYTTAAEFRRATGQGGSFLEMTGQSPVGPGYTPSTAVRSKAASVAVPLPASLAHLAALTSGVRHLGAFSR